MSKKALVLTGCIGAPVCIVVGFFLNAIAFRVLWAWFAVDGFGAKPISLPLAIGIAEIVGLLTWAKTDSGGDTSDKENSEIIMRMVSATVLRPLFFLVVGFFAHRAMH